MADFDAIAGVSTTLQNLLRDRMAEAVAVTIAPPDVTVSDAGDVRLNLYLYLVTEDAFLKNQEIPGHGHPGMFGHPPLSLDLHYLLTAHGGSDTGAHADLKAQRILGDAMRVLHDFPIVTGNLRITRAQAGAVGAAILDTSLLEEFERIKITFQPMTLDDLSKIWTALPQANFRRSVAYLVNVVQIVSQQPRRVPRPVGEPPSAGPRVAVMPFQSPQIHELRVRRPGDPANTERPLAYARIGDTVIIRGRHFVSHAIRVTLGSVDATAQITTLQGDRIEVTIPDDPGLQPGAQAVQVVLEVMMGEPPMPHRGFHSNLAVFMLVPQVTGLTLDVTTIPRALQIQGKRLFLDTLTGETVIGSVSISKTLYHNDAKATEILVPLPDTLPAWPVPCLMSGTLASVPSLPDKPQVRVTIGSDGPRDITLTDKATTLAELAGVLQYAIRQAKDGGPAFKGARVTTVAGNRLVIVPGGVVGDHHVTIASTTTDTVTATALGMSEAVKAYLSGVLAPFPVLTAQHPAVRLTVGSTPQTVTLAQRPTTLAAAASTLAAAINALPPEAHVTTLDSQLLMIVPATVQTLTFAPVPGGDETTVAELQLRASYPVRVRVNGAENIETMSVELPS